MVTPRLIGRLEIAYADGSTETVVTNRDWRSAFGPMVTDHWFGGTDYDARREQAGWTEPGADLSPSASRRDGTEVGWRSAGIAPPPNLTTKLAARNAEPVKVQRTFTPVKLTNPQPGVWVFDFGQNFAGWPELRLPDGVPAGTAVRMLPGETLNANGTVNQASIGVGGRGSDIFATYTTLGTPGGETWHPKFNYFGMQYLQVTGLPACLTPTTDMIRGLQLFADVPRAGDIETSNERINRLHRMSYYSITSNTMSVFTDCPGREKLPYGADYVQPMGSLGVNFDYAAYLRNMQVQLVEGQSKAGLDAGNVALKTPVYDWGYSGQFGDEINWGSSIVQVPYLLYKLYGDTQTMRDHYDAMKTYMDFVARRKAEGAEFIVTALLADWVASEQTSQQLLGTWGYYLSARYMSEMAALTGRNADAAAYGQLAQNIKTAFNSRFFNTTLHRYTAAGNGGTTGATQTAQAVALDAGLVPEGERAERAQRPRREHLRVPALRWRPALQRRHHRPRSGRPCAARGRPLGRPVGRLAGGHAAQLRILPAADDRASGGPDDPPRALDVRRLAEPHDPAADRGVVPHRGRRHQAGAGIDRLPRADLQADPGRRPDARQGPLRHASGHGAQRMAP